MTSLPLVDGAFLIDNSTIEQLQACPRYYQYGSLMKRALVTNRAGRNFGSCLHFGLALRYKLVGHNQVTPDVETIINDAMVEYMQNSPPPEDDFRDAAHAQKVMKKYNELYSFEPFRVMAKPDGTPLVEASFAIKIGEVQNVPIIYTGRSDLPWIQTDDGDWVMDHKTAFMFGQSFEDEMRMNSGQVGYVWAHRETFVKKPRGYIINAIRVRRPTKAQEYGGAPCDASDFNRIPFDVSDDMLDEWKTNVLSLIATLFWHYDNEYFPRQTRWCVSKYGRCDFYEVCNVVRDMRSQVLDSNLFENNEWSPLNKPNT